MQKVQQHFTSKIHVLARYIATSVNKRPPLCTYGVMVLADAFWHLYAMFFSLLFWFVFIFPTKICQSVWKIVYTNWSCSVFFISAKIREILSVNESKQKEWQTKSNKTEFSQTELTKPDQIESKRSVPFQLESNEINVKLYRIGAYANCTRFWRWMNIQNNKQTNFVRFVQSIIIISTTVTTAAAARYLYVCDEKFDSFFYRVNFFRANNEREKKFCLVSNRLASTNKSFHLDHAPLNIC